MLKIKLTAGSTYISWEEEQAILRLQQLLPTEDGYIIPIMFVGKGVVSREIDAMLILPDIVFLLDFKNFSGQRIEVPGANGEIRRLRHGAWGQDKNTIPNYQYAARELASQLMRERGWLPTYPPIYTVMVFTSIGFSSAPEISFAGGDPNKPLPSEGAGACRIEQLAQLIAEFRRNARPRVQLNPSQLSMLTQVLIDQIKPLRSPVARRIDNYIVLAEHHVDTFLDCKIYLAQGETITEPVWIKEYDQVLASSEKHRSEREQLVLRHADVLHRFPQQKNIVAYRNYKTTASHLYVILSRTPGAFLSELLAGKAFLADQQAELQRIPFDLTARLHLLGGLLQALEYLTRQPGFEKSAYRDLRPDNVFVQYTNSTPEAQLFNFDCTKIPGAITRRGHLKQGLERSTSWEDYASPELLQYVDAGLIEQTSVRGFMGDVKSDLFSWAIIAWELLTGELPFADNDAKLAGKRHSWPAQLSPQLQATGNSLSPAAIRLFEACLDPSPSLRPSLATLRNRFP